MKSAARCRCNHLSAADMAVSSHSWLRGSSPGIAMRVAVTQVRCCCAARRRNCQCASAVCIYSLSCHVVLSLVRLQGIVQGLHCPL